MPKALSMLRSSKENFLFAQDLIEKILSEKEKLELEMA
jgi:hypothetical protein